MQESETTDIHFTNSKLTDLSTFLDK